MEADFSGYATKANLRCSDGRIITPNAFKHDGQSMTVPLVWQHSHDDPKNVLGKATLEHRDDGVYAYAFFNDSPEAQHAKTLVEHGDVVALSIYANQLQEKSKQVTHGVIRELSLVLSGANPGALIDQIRIAHSDGSIDTLEDEAIITMGLALEHGSPEGETVEHADGAAAPKKTLAEVLETLNDEQTEAVNFIVGTLVEENQAAGAAKHSAVDDESDDTSDDESDAPAADDAQSEDAPAADDATPAADNPVDGENNEGAIAHQEGTTMTRNVFDGDASSASDGGTTLTHDQMSTIFADARKPGMTLKTAILAHADDYGIKDIEMLFPDAREIDPNNPEINARRTEWVAKVLGGTKHTPFSKVRSTVFDITADEARAKGYVKGTLKVDEVITLLRRTTGPTTIYKKQRLDRDDIIDINDMDVVAFLKAEMRFMIEEEVARAILVGDGRAVNAPDKVKDPAGSVDGNGIRSIMNDADFYAVKHELAANVSPKDAVKGLVRARAKYRGTGKPTLFLSDNFLTDIMLEEDKFGRPLYETQKSLEDKLRVESIVTVDIFDDHENLFGIMVNMFDYSIGTNKGGELTSFNQFDIDYNQEKFLQETRLSGALTKPFSAVVVTRPEGTLVESLTAPSFDGTTNVITIPAVTGVVYTIDEEVVAAGALPAITSATEVVASAADGYYFPANTTRSWTYTP